MADLTIAPARLVDVWPFETTMRPADVAEVMASDGFTPVEAILASWEASREAWTVHFNGEVGAMFGVVVHPRSSVLAPIGVVWMLTTTVVDRYPVAFYKASRKVVRDLSQRYGMLFNYVDTRYTQAVEWARRIGFETKLPMALGVHGELFTPITFGG